MSTTNSRCFASPDRSRAHPVFPFRQAFLGAHTVPPEFKGKADAYVDMLCAEALPQAAEAGLVDAVDAYCESIAFSSAQIAKLFDKAHSLEPARQTARRPVVRLRRRRTRGRLSRPVCRSSRICVRERSRSACEIRQRRGTPSRRFFNAGRDATTAGGFAKRASSSNCGRYRL